MQAQESNLYRHYVASTAERDGMALLFLSSTILCYSSIIFLKTSSCLFRSCVTVLVNPVLEALLKYIYQLLC
jgi:hypothetical protein